MTLRGFRLAAPGLALAIVVVGAGACGSSSTPSSSTPSSSTPSSSSTSGSPYTLAVVADITGAQAPSGAPLAAGTQTAVQVINAAGGVDGHPLKVKIDDSQSTPSALGSATRAAAASKPTVITGFNISTNVSGASSVLGQAELPVVSAVVDPPLTTPVPKPWFFATSPGTKDSATEEIGGMKALLGGSLTGKRLAFEGFQTPLVTEIFAAAKKQAEAQGATIVDTEYTDLSLTSFSSQAAKIVGAKADGVFILDTDPSTVIVAHALTAAGFKGKLLGAEGNNSLPVYQQVDQSNFYSIGSRNPITPPALLAAAKKYGESKQAANSYFEAGWVDAYTIAGALSKCTYPCPPSQFESALDSAGQISIPGNAIAGGIEFSPTDHVGVTDAQLYSYDASTKKLRPYGTLVSLQ